MTANPLNIALKGYTPMDNPMTILGRMQAQIDHLQNRIDDKHFATVDRLAELAIELEQALLEQQLTTSVAHLRTLVEDVRRES